MTKIKKQPFFKKRIFKLLLIGAFLALCLLILFLVSRGKQNSTAATSPVTIPGSSKVDLSPPTSADKTAADENKERIVQREEQKPSNSDKKSVTPIITSTSSTDLAIGVFAYIPSIVETGGTCTLTLTSSIGSATVSKAASAEGTSTNCGGITIARSELTAGETYKAVVKYDSPTTSGISTQEWSVTVD